MNKSVFKRALVLRTQMLKHEFSGNGNNIPKLDATGKIYSEKFYTDKTSPKYESYTFPKRRWTDEELDVKITHLPPETTSDKAAYYTVRMFRFGWDLFSGYTFGHRLGWFKWGDRMWLKRVIFLESIAGMYNFVIHHQTYIYIINCVIY